MSCDGYESQPLHDNTEGKNENEILDARTHTCTALHIHSSVDIGSELKAQKSGSERTAYYLFALRFRMLMRIASTL